MNSQINLNDKTDNVRPVVLFADDEARMRRIVVDYLDIKGYDVIEASDGIEALELFDKHNPDLVLLDIMMPNLDGWEVCNAIKKNSDIPIIMLTAKSQEQDELKGFELGADEYITKPFSLKVLLARIEAVLRRSSTIADINSNEFPEIPGIIINRESREVTVDNTLIELTFTEFELLSYLQKNVGIALSRDKILDNVWRYDYYGDTRTVDTHIKKLRKKLGSRGKQIKTIRGIGYKLEVE